MSGSCFLHIFDGLMDFSNFDFIYRNYPYIECEIRGRTWGRTYIYVVIKKSFQYSVAYKILMHGVYYYEEVFLHSAYGII